MDANTGLTLALFPLQVTKSERQVMKPLYDRYRLVKQILCRASTIPVIVSVSSSSSFSVFLPLPRPGRPAALCRSPAGGKPNPRLTPAVPWEPGGGFGGGRATDVLSTFQRL